NSARLPHLFKMAQSALSKGDVSPAAAQEIRAEIDTHRDHFLSTGLQLGFSYGPPVQGPADPMRYEPSVQPGARMPHAWLQRDGKRLSTLDLLSLGGFTLLAGPAGTAWRAFATQARNTHVVELDSSYRFESAWPATAIVNDAGAILVRPDGHIGIAVPDDSTASQQRVRDTLDRFLPH
ncbi:MAG TPA: hypothetical protein VJQ81_06505, partial [Reyranella sp.]|nr:hypothetical protein [Reyranella sp.]